MDYSDILKIWTGNWIFGYGSLMWDPGFLFLEKKISSLPNQRRELNMYSYLSRGTPDNPGLVLGLEYHPSSACIGVSFRISEDQKESVAMYLEVGFLN
jgi:cation transport protein ChaC